MRVRVLELRLLAAALCGLWATTAVLVEITYRPGGPVDFLVGITILLPAAIAGLAVIYPPSARSMDAFRTIASLAVASGLLLLPSLAGLYRQLTDRGLQTLLPSVEASYSWGLALAGTALFSGMGLARRARSGSGRPRRLAIAIGAGAVMAAISGTLVAAVATANNLALRDRPAAASRFGPTNPDLVPPVCTRPIVTPDTAQLVVTMTGTVDGGSLGSARIRGSRSGLDFSWTAEVGTSSVFGLTGEARVGGRAWSRDIATGWQAVPVARVTGGALDLPLLETALQASRLTAAEDVGLSYVEGARARQCRVAVDGDTYREAFPQVSYFAGTTDLRRWRGEVDYWVFGDGEVGSVDAWIEGEGFALRPDAIRGRLEAELTATDRGSPLTIEPPAP